MFRIKCFFTLCVGLIFFIPACNKKTTSSASSHAMESQKRHVDTVNNHTESLSQVKVVPADPQHYYREAYTILSNMLSGKEPISFKKAVFVTENAFYENVFDYSLFDTKIKRIVDVCKITVLTKKLNYSFPDSTKVQKNASIFFYFSDTTFYLENDKLSYHFPIQYDFDDYRGTKDWTNMFVTKLLTTNKGNCHSLPFLYKIVADEMQTEAYLSLAPNHIYIKHKSKMTGWYNTELTSKQFPVDAWVMASGYITLDAIRNGIYMDTLSLKQSVALCLVDLAKGYERKFGNSNDQFIIQCCDLALIYYPNYINAMLLKAEFLKKRFNVMMKQYNAKHPSEIFNIKEANDTYQTMQGIYINIMELGYREMPEKMYLEWLSSVKSEKFKNKKIEGNRLKNTVK